MKKTLMLSFLLACMLPLGAQEKPQLYNSHFDTWTKVKGAWVLHGSNPSADEMIWDTANKGMSLLGINGSTPDYFHVAVPGEGKAAVRIESKKILWAFVAGNIYTGRFRRIVNFKGAELDFGIPFTARPARFRGYYHYIPKDINFAKAPYLSMKGKPDVGLIEVLLLDMDGQMRINTTVDHLIDPKTDPRVIGKASVMIDKGTDDYVYFDIPFEYFDDRTPKYLLFTAAASRLGEYFTGADGSVLYVDECEFKY